MSQLEDKSIMCFNTHPFLHLLPGGSVTLKNLKLQMFSQIYIEGLS